MLNARMPVARLSTGLLVANFCSGHDFTFDDGTVLGSCPTSRVEGSKLALHEQSTQMDGWTDIVLCKEVGPVLAEMLDDVRNWARKLGEPVVVLVPFMLLDTIQPILPDDPFRAIRRNGRVGDGKGEGRICHDRFCTLP